MMKVRIEPWDETSTYRNTTMLQLGDLVTVTITSGGNYRHTVMDEHGAVKLFEIVSYGHQLGIRYPTDDQFVSLSGFAPNVEFEIVGRSQRNE